jgi:hypothetical protein
MNQSNRAENYDKLPFLIVERILCCRAEGTRQRKANRVGLRHELAMVFRLQELADSADGHKERVEIAAASENLLALKTLILGWPSPLNPSDPQQ